MLISVRNKDNRLLIKDILDIDFNMSVKKRGEKYYVAVNHKYHLDTVFDDEAAAEEKMLEIAALRNNLEEELKYY